MLTPFKEGGAGLVQLSAFTYLPLVFVVWSQSMHDLNTCGATISPVWPGGAAKVRGPDHNALDAQHQHSCMRNEDQYLIQIYSQGALTCV